MKTAEQLIEQIDQLDELSKDTLASYVGKAAKSYNKSDKQLGLADKANFGTISSDERKKYDKNVVKVSGNKGELSTDDYDKHDAHHMDKLAKRDKGMKKAVSKLTKESLESLELNLEDYTLEELQDFVMSEDFEQLDELSKETLASYIDKANKDKNAHFSSGEDLDNARYKGYHTKKSKAATKSASSSKEYQRVVDRVGDKDRAAAIYHDKKAKDRLKGLSKARNKLKESIEAMVSAVLDGDQESASDAFNQAMSEKISERMDSIKQEIASGL